MMTKQEQKDYAAFLEEKRLQVMDLELNARRQAALTSIKRDFIEECNITDEYQRLFKIEQEKFAAAQAAQGGIQEVSDPEELEIVNKTV